MTMNKTWNVFAMLCILLVLPGCMEAQWVSENIQRLQAEAAERKKYANEPEYTAPLASLPKGLKFPIPLKFKMNYSYTEKTLAFRGVMEEEEKNTLLALSGDKSYQDAVKKLYQNALPKPTEIPIVSSNNNGEKQVSTTGPEVILMDGNVIKGSIKDKFDFQTELATLKINGEDIVSYLDGKLNLKDGNVLLGKIVSESLKIQTDYGELEASADSIASITGK